MSVDPTRSRIMGAVGRYDTPPEMLVRRFLHRAGYRYRVHRKDLPGRPDIVLPRYRVAIFVHGCFWHRHTGCRRTTTPKTRREFWQAKFAANIARDRRSYTALEAIGWRVVVIWECEAVQPSWLEAHLVSLVTGRERAIGPVAELMAEPGSYSTARGKNPRSEREGNR